MGILDIFKSKKKTYIVNNIKKSPGAYSGNYLTGGFGGFSGGAKYHNGLSDGSAHYINNRAVRLNARNAYHDTPEAKGIITRFADTIVDRGLRLEPTPKAEVLGISQEAAEEWGRNVADKFDLWARSKDSSRNGINNFYQNQRLYCIFQHRDGENFVRFYYTKNKNLINPLQLQFLDPQQIRGDQLINTWGLNYESDTDGIKKDAAGKAIEYNVYQMDPKTRTYKCVKVPAKGPKSQKTMMIHGFMPEYSSQTRGFSRLEHILQEFADLTDFKLSTIKKAISQSQITMYVKPSQDNDSSNPLEDIANFSSGPSSFKATDPNGDTIEVNNIVEGCAVDYEPIPTAGATIPGSMGVFNLKKGEDLKQFETQKQGEAFNEFVDSYLSYVSSSLGLPIEVLKMQFGQNYSASRGTLVLYWRVANIWRDEMQADFLDPTYEAWLSEEIAAGRITAPGWSDPNLRKAWLSARWIGSPMPNIDPAKTAKADQIYAEMGATNLDIIAQDLNGSDGRTNRQKLKRQYEELPTAPWKKAEKKQVEVDDDDVEDSKKD